VIDARGNLAADESNHTEQQDQHRAIRGVEPIWSRDITRYGLLSGEWNLAFTVFDPWAIFGFDPRLPDLARRLYLEAAVIVALRTAVPPRPSSATTSRVP
jgi:hypothetical protein